VSAFDQSLFVTASCGQFSWETENAIRGEERRGIIRIKEVSEVWREDGASVVLWA
jgi:hypothetical protein